MMKPIEDHELERLIKAHNPSYQSMEVRSEVVVAMATELLGRRLAERSKERPNG